MCCIACCMTILHFEQWPTRIFIPTACCMACFFSLCCAVCSLRHTKVAQELAKHFQHSQHAFLGRFNISMQFEHVPGLFFLTGPQNEVISHAYFRYRYRHLSYGKRPMFLASPHWCGHALSNWEQNTWFEVRETRVSQESARCCSASVISIFLCFCLLLPGYWYIWTWSLLNHRWYLMNPAFAPPSGPEHLGKCLWHDAVFGDVWGAAAQGHLQPPRLARRRSQGIFAAFRRGLGFYCLHTSKAVDKR